MPAKCSNPTFTERGQATMQRAGKLRKGPTPADQKLWTHLRGNKPNGVNFRCQQAIGNYIVDFCAIKAKLVIELDSSQHIERDEYDLERTAYLES